VTSDMNFDSPKDIGAALESFADQNPSAAAQSPKYGQPVFSKLNLMFTVVLMVSVIGFSGANWMMYKRLTQLSTTTADLQSKFADIDTNKHKGEKNMQRRLAGLEESFRQVRLKIGQQSGDDQLVALELRLVEAEKEISRLRLVMHSTIKHKRIRYTKTLVKKSRPAHASIKPKPEKTTLVSSNHKTKTRPKPTPSTPISKKPKGNWFVNLATRSDESAADSELKKIRQSGMMAEKHGVQMHGNKYWRLSVSGFPSREAAHAFIRNVAARHGFPDAWVYQMSSRR